MFLTRVRSLRYRLYRRIAGAAGWPSFWRSRSLLTAAALAHHAPAPGSSHTEGRAQQPATTRTPAKTSGNTSTRHGRPPARACAGPTSTASQLPVSAAGRATPHQRRPGLGIQPTPRAGRCWRRSTSLSAPPPSGDRRSTSRRSATRSPARTPAALLQADASDYAALRAAAHVRPGQPAGRGYAVEAGYRFAAYTPASATVDIVTEGPGSGGDHRADRHPHRGHLAAR